MSGADASTPPAPFVLVIEDEPQMMRFLRPALVAHGFRLEEALSGAEGLRLAAMRAPDVVILDLGLPDIDGLEVTRRLREWTTVPIVVLSARGQERDKIDALDAGADDYVTKPFGMGELLARVRVALRHASRSRGEPATGSITLGAVRLDLDRRQVFVNGSEVHLTPLEYRLFTALARSSGRVLTHRQLLTEVWGPAYATQHHYLRVYMAQLRHKLERDPSRPELLLTEPGVGYRLRDDA
jgi:two-component system KDP operon response regulator KdpE